MSSLSNSYPIAVLISGRGSNLGAIINAIKETRLEAEIKIVISNNKNAAGLELARESGIKTECCDVKLFETKDKYEEKIADLIEKSGAKLIILAGYMRVIGETFIKRFNNNIINIHPSLLPSFKGLNAQKQALDYGVKVAGCTVHYVTEEVDGGQIIDQVAVEIEETDTEESLSQRILKEEHQLYPKVIQKIIEERRTI